MKRRTVLGAVTLVLAAAGCTSDPTSSLRGGPARLLISNQVLTVDVGDSVAVTATAVDEQGNPLSQTPEATSDNPAVVSVIPVSGAPLPQARFFVKGLAFGEGTVSVTSSGITESIRVLAYPASVLVTGQPDSLSSGASVVLTATPVGADNQPVAGVPIEWEIDDEAVAGLDVSGASATVTGRLPGVASIGISVPGDVSTTVPVLVVPAPFAGSLSAASGAFGDEVTATRGPGDQPFETATTVTVGGNPAWITSVAADNISFLLPPVPETGENEVRFNGLGPEGLAARSSIDMTTAGGLDDPGEATSNDPTTAPVVTNGEYYFTLHGACVNGVASTAGDDCDDFFTVTNSTAADINVTTHAEWPDDSDVDILWCNAACTAFAGNFAGATGNNPEESTVTVAPGTTLRLWLNLFAAGSDPYAFVHLTVSGLP